MFSHTSSKIPREGNHIGYKDSYKEVENVQKFMTDGQLMKTRQY